MLRHVARFLLLTAVLAGGLFAAFGVPANAVDARQMVFSAALFAAIVYAIYRVASSRRRTALRERVARAAAVTVAYRDERARDDAEWEAFDGPRYRLAAGPSKGSSRVLIELQERLRVYQNELETHTLSAAEIPRRLLVFGPARWETADSAEVARELWQSLQHLYARYAREWEESGNVNYPVVWRASFTMLSKHEDPGRVAVTFRSDEDGELSSP